MFNKIKDNWFGIFIGSIVAFTFLLVAIVSIAPHNDSKMRGFSGCSFELAQNLSIHSGKKNVFGVMETVFQGYYCYSLVIYEGFCLWKNDKQDTPWENYIFEVENFEIKPELSEPFSKDLIKANLLNDEDGDIFEIKENDDDRK